MRVGEYFLRGVARLFGFCPSERHEFLNRTDADAIRSDWEAVGRDIQAAIADYRRARGILPWTEGDEPAEVSIRRIRGGRE